MNIAITFQPSACDVYNDLIIKLHCEFTAKAVQVKSQSCPSQGHQKSGEKVLSHPHKGLKRRNRWRNRPFQSQIQVQVLFQLNRLKH